MSSSSVYSLLKDHLEQYFRGLYPVLDFDTIEPSMVQAQNCSFLVLEEVGSGEVLSGMGDQNSLCFRESGLILIHLFMEAPESSRDLRAGVDTVRDSLRSLVSGGLRVISVSPPEPNEFNIGLWSSMSTSVTYEYDFHQAQLRT